MNKLPKSRNENIVVQNLENEVLIYDTNTNQAFCLNETSANVFNHCDGQTTFGELKRRHNFTDDLIYLTLDELKKNDLLEAYRSDHFKGLTRREVVKRVGLASAAALPLIVGLVAPPAAHAQSGQVTCSGQSCTCSVPNNNANGSLPCNALGGQSTCPTAGGCDCDVTAGGATGICNNNNA